MATYASRPAWEKRARVVSTSAWVAVPLGLGALVAVSLLLRSGELDRGFWIDEGLSVGIADRPLLDIPGILRLDGSPPIYYALLHVWLGLAGRSEEATHALSLGIALLSVPVAWWAARLTFGTRAGWMAAALVALNPFLTEYAQETRMYALVVLLGLIACGTFLRAFASDEVAPGRRWPLGFAVALTAMLYTHNWALFFGAACGAAWLVLIALSPPGLRDRRRRDGLLAFGATALLYLPWVPTLIFQARHTGAPWATRPLLSDLLEVPQQLLGVSAGVLLLLAAGSGLASLFEGRRDPGRSAAARAAVALAIMAVLTIVIAFAVSQVSPAWAMRYQAVGLAPALLLAGAGLAYARGIGLAGIVLVGLFWASDAPPKRKSNVSEVAAAIAPSVSPGDVVVSTWPEQIPVLDYYLPDGLRYATIWGPVDDLGVTDWRDGVERMAATSAEKDLKPVLDALPTGRRLVLVTPIIYSLGRWKAPWTELVRLRSLEWRQFVSNDRRLSAVAVRPPDEEPGVNQQRATVLLKG